MLEVIERVENDSRSTFGPVGLADKKVEHYVVRIRRLDEARDVFYS